MKLGFGDHNSKFRIYKTSSGFIESKGFILVEVILVKILFCDKWHDFKYVHYINDKVSLYKLTLIH